MIHQRYLLPSALLSQCPREPLIKTSSFSNYCLSPRYIAPLLLPQETETTGQAPGGSEGGEGVTDVIQQLLELSEQVSGETPQPQPPEPAITMETAINQDILQVSEGYSPTK